MDQNKVSRPDWQPEDAGSEFACRVMGGVLESEVKRPAYVPPKRKQLLSASEYAEGILAQNRVLLAQAITIIESNAQKHFELGQEIIKLILPHTGKAARVGITGVPGAGKSTFIEALGNFLCDRGKKVAVLAVDPSSTLSKGSILGDKTRMETLSKRETAFIRPSPSGGTLGGVTRKSRETMLLCEAAGFDTLLIETVGVGQSETTVRSMVDFFLVVVITGAGDDLQGIKKGVIEIADAILVNKADGDNKQKAMMARSEYEQVLHYLRPATPGWQTKAYTASALTGEGIDQIWGVVCEFLAKMQQSGYLEERRRDQNLTWVMQMTEEHVRSRILKNESVQRAILETREELSRGGIAPTMAASKLIRAIEEAM